MQQDINAVRSFWENNPLFSGESRFPLGSREYFEEHRSVVINDCFAGAFDPATLPPAGNRDAVLDLGCGPGFWSVELQLKCPGLGLISADLTETACRLTRLRLESYGLPAHRVQRENAEQLSFQDGSLSHVNCQGVIHHTPHTERCVAEIARVLRDGGTASISVYYRNIVLRNFGILKWVAKAMYMLGAKLPGRGREGIYRLNDVDDVVRFYDGAENPIGKSYSRSQFVEMLEHHFEVEAIYFHFFPARSLPFPIPAFLHRILDRWLPFMIYANVRKKPVGGGAAA